MKKFTLLALLVLSGYWLKAQIVVNFSNITTACNNDGSATATASGGTAPYTYQWYSYSNNTAPVATGPTFSNSNGGSFYVVVTDANSNTSPGYWVNIPNTLQVYPTNMVNPTCPLSNGSITYTVNGGAAPYNFVWSSGQTFLGETSNFTTVSGLAQGQYSVVVTDANGCIFNHTDSIATLYGIAPFTLTTSTTPANCNDGTATANISGSGTAPYTYYWTTTPPQTTATATGLDGGAYQYVTVTDADGCMANAYSYISYGPSALQMSSIIYDAICPNNNGSINLSVYNGTAPYTYAWSNGASTQDLNGLAQGSYTITVTDNAGCHLSATKYVGQSSNVSAYVTTSPTNCSNNNGSASVNASGGVAPYTYLWANGQTTSSISGLSAGYYGVSVTDANGCHNNYGAYGYVNIPVSCYNGITGFVYNDEDGNCTLNANETGLPYQILDLGNGYYSSTNYNGFYQYTALTPSTYTISHTPSANWNLMCPTASYIVSPSAGQFIGGNDFYDQPINTQNDVSIYVYNGLARPGFAHNKYYYIQNHGTSAVSGTVEITYDALEDFQGSPYAIAYNPTAHTVTLAYNNIPPFGSTNGYLNFSLPATVAIGTTLTTTGIVNPIAGDANPSDNYDTTSTNVVGSYDPNFKEVSPAGIGASGLISANNTHLDYTIHFQNTGTYAAQTVVIVDTLDQDLDINSFELLGASHNVTWSINGPRIVKFTFDYINLPDSATNEPASHGLVSYRINQKQNLSGGTEIKNTAYIYFDYNTPIVTNTTLNTIEIVGIKENKFNNGVTISPNPAQDRISVSNKTKEQCSKIEIMDINGRVITSITPSGSSIQLPDLANGVYILSAHYNSGIYKEKLIISK